MEVIELKVTNNSQGILEIECDQATLPINTGTELDDKLKVYITNRTRSRVTTTLNFDGIVIMQGKEIVGGRGISAPQEIPHAHRVQNHKQGQVLNFDRTPIEKKPTHTRNNASSEPLISVKEGIMTIRFLITRLEIEEQDERNDESMEVEYSWTKGQAPVLTAMNHAYQKNPTAKKEVRTFRKTATG